MTSPIRPGSPHTVSTTPSTSTTAPAKPATPAAPTAPSGPAHWGAAVAHKVTGAVSDAFGKVESKLTGHVAQQIRSAGPSDYELVPGRMHATAGLPQVLSAVGNSPEGQAMVKQMAEQFQSKTGLQVPPDIMAASMQNPGALTKAFEVSPNELSKGLMGLNTAYKAGKIKDASTGTNALPQKFDFAKLGDVKVNTTMEPPKQIAPGLYTGELPSSLPAAQLKQNKVVAEVFTRLSRNASAAPGDQFEVTYGGKSFTKLDDFLGALKADGYEVKASFDSRAANFTDLKTTVPGSNPPKFVDVAAPMMIRTGIKDAQGHEAVVPAAHSEMVISLHAGPNTKGPKIDSDVRYFQGVSGTGFFPAGGAAESEWTGRVSHGVVSGDDALKAVRLAGRFTDLVHSAATSEHLYAEGYGVTGVCNDSVAVVQQAIMGRADEYPLLMQDSRLQGELKKRLSNADKSDDADFKLLKKAIADLPSDVRANPSAARRALSSLSWAPGQEPFTSTVDARKILGGG